MNSARPDFGLYVITDKKLSQGKSHLEVAKEAVAGGATCIQLRDKEASVRELFFIAKQLREITAKYEATFIVNDRLDVALAVEADGVHLGVDDLPIFAARRIMPQTMLLGISPDKPEQACEAERAGASYLGIGPVFSTSTKSDAGEPIGVEKLAKSCRSVSIPVVGIGGIDAGNAKEVIRAGAEGAAVISCIVGAKDVRNVARDLKREIDTARALQRGGPAG